MTIILYFCRDKNQALHLLKIHSYGKRSSSRQCWKIESIKRHPWAFRKSVWQRCHYEIRRQSFGRNRCDFEWIHSLDIAMGVNGFPKGRVIEIFGPESSGKTTLACMPLPNPNAKEALLLSSMPNMLSTGFMPENWVLTSKTYWYRNPTTGSKPWNYR